MANKRLSDLPVVTSTTTGDVLAIDGATTRQVTVENLLGDNVQSIKALTSAADKVPYFTGAGTSDVADFTSYGRSIVAVADEAAFKALTNLEIGTDVQSYSSALDAVSGTNTGDQTITLTGDVAGTGTGSFATTISATAVTSSMLNPDVFSTAHSWSGQQTFVAPALGTPASGVATNLTGTASGLTAGHVTTNADLTGDVTSVGNATTIGSTKVTSSMLNADVFSTAHSWSGVQTFTDPVVGTQTSGDSSTKAASTAFVQAAVVASGGALSLFFGTVADVQAATIPAIVERVETSGYAAEGDGGGSIATKATYERVGSLPSHAGYIQSADGAYWELTGRRVSVRQFGAVPVVSNLDTDPDAAAAINLCMAYCNLKHTDMLIPSGMWPLDAPITSPTFIITINGEQGSSQPTILYKRYVESNSFKGVISLTAWGATITDLQFAAKSGVSGGSALSAILPGNAANIGILHIERFYVSGGDSYNHDLYIDGTANTNVGGPGYRSTFIHEAHFFGSASSPVYLTGVQHLFGTDWFMATTGGSNASGFIMIVDGTVAAYSDDIQISSGLLSGNVNINQTSRAMLMTRIDGNFALSSSCSGVGALSVGGTVTDSGTGNFIINDSWKTTSPTPTASSGTLGSASSTITYKKLGKTVFCQVDARVATVGTGSGSLRLQLPFTLANDTTGSGRENGVNGNVFGVLIPTSGLMVFFKYDNTTAIVAGGVYQFNFVAQLA